MASAMAKVYVSLIEKGKRTIETVPEKIRDEVQALLDEKNASTGVDEENV